MNFEGTRLSYTRTYVYIYRSNYCFECLGILSCPYRPYHHYLHFNSSFWNDGLWVINTKDTEPELFPAGSHVEQKIWDNFDFTDWPLVENEGINLYIGILGIHSLIPY